MQIDLTHHKSSSISHAAASVVKL